MLKYIDKPSARYTLVYVSANELNKTNSALAYEWYLSEYDDGYYLITNTAGNITFEYIETIKDDIWFHIYV